MSPTVARPSDTSRASRLPPSPERQRVEALADLLDTRFRVPVLGWRFGVDGLLGLVPGIGDAAGLTLAAAVVLQAVRLGARGATVVRMVLNVVLDTVFGSIPVLGSVWDFVFRANTRNVRLLERHVDDADATRARSGAAIRNTIIGVVVALVATVALLLGALVALLAAVF